ncbi:uncharacterized [Tachysurus ichikawai]
MHGGVGPSALGALCGNTLHGEVNERWLHFLSCSGPDYQGRKAETSCLAAAHMDYEYSGMHAVKGRPGLETAAIRLYFTIGANTPYPYDSGLGRQRSYSKTKANGAYNQDDRVDIYGGSWTYLSSRAHRGGTVEHHGAVGVYVRFSEAQWQQSL